MRKSYFTQILISMFPAILLFRPFSLFLAILLNFEKQFHEMNELMTQEFLHTNLGQFGPAEDNK